MFEREINFIYDFNANKVRRAGTYISYDQLKTCGLHPAIFRYILGEIDFLIFEDRQKLLAESAFDYNIQSVQNYLYLIGEEVKLNKKYSVNYIDKIIQHAATFTVNYLTKPNWTLMRFVYDDDSEKSSSELEQILSYTFYYPHLKKIIISYLKKKKMTSVSLSDFQELLVKIDTVGLETNYNKIIDEALDSMADFFNIGVSKTTQIPIKAVEYFLLDKNLRGHLKKLEKDYNTEASPKVNAIEIKEYLKRILIEKPEYLEDESNDSLVQNSKIEFTNLDDNSSVRKTEHESLSESDFPTKNEEILENNVTEIDTNLLESTEPAAADELIHCSENKESLDDSSEKQLDLINDDMMESPFESLTEDEQVSAESDEKKSINIVTDEFENSEMDLQNEINEVKFNNPDNVELTEILNDKSMSKILDVVFDYDVEEFSNSVKKIIGSASEDEACLLIDKICETAKLKPDSKESKIFKTMISKYFK